VLHIYFEIFTCFYYNYLREKRFQFFFHFSSFFCWVDILSLIYLVYSYKFGYWFWCVFTIEPPLIIASKVQFLYLYQITNCLCFYSQFSVKPTHKCPWYTIIKEHWYGWLNLKQLLSFFHLAVSTQTLIWCIRHFDHSIS
jgi:hypothetical protein